MQCHNGTLKAQSNNTEDLQKMLVGTWEPQHGKIPGRIQTLVFFADGVVNYELLIDRSRCT